MYVPFKKIMAHATSCPAKFCPAKFCPTLLVTLKLPRDKDTSIAHEALYTSPPNLLHQISSGKRCLSLSPEK
jgi:hypothetical protein